MFDHLPKLSRHQSELFKEFLAKLLGKTYRYKFPPDLIPQGQRAYISHVRPGDIWYQSVVEGKLISKFDGNAELGYVGGTIICDPCTREQCRKWDEMYAGPDGWDEHGGILSDTVTRCGQLFWDMGYFYPRENEQ